MSWTAEMTSNLLFGMVSQLLYDDSSWLSGLLGGGSLRVGLVTSRLGSS